MSIYTLPSKDLELFETLKTHVVEESTLEPIDFSLAIGPKLFGSDNGMYGKTHSEKTKNTISATNKGKTVVKDKDGNYFSVPIDDPRYLSKELVGHARGKIAVKDSDGNNFLVESNDPRYLTGELVGVARGKRWKQKNPGKLKGTILVKGRDGSMCRVKLDDPRYVSGELIHFKKSF